MTLVWRDNTGQITHIIAKHNWIGFMKALGHSKEKIEEALEETLRKEAEYQAAHPGRVGQGEMGDERFFGFGPDTTVDFSKLEPKKDTK